MAYIFLILHTKNSNNILHTLLGVLGLFIALSTYAGNPEESCELDYILNLNSNLQYCYNDRNNIFLDVDIENISSDSLTGSSIGWLANGLSGAAPIGDGIEPNGFGSLTLPPLSFSSEGSYWVTFWVERNCEGNIIHGDSVSVLITIRSPFTVDLPANFTKCLGSPYTLATPSGLGTYQWSTGDSSNSISVDVSGKYLVTVTDGFGCEAIDSITVDNYLVPGDVGDDTVICVGTILTVDVGPGFSDYIWSNGMTSNSIQISEPGIYSVVVQDTNGCVYNDTINVQRAPVPSPSAPALLNVCFGDTAIVGAAPNFTSYTWSTGDTTTAISIYSSGVYMITVVGAYGCIGIDTITVNVIPLPVVTFSDSVMCNNNPYVMDIGQWYPSVQWSTGDTSQNILVSSPGSYVVSVTDLSGCHSSDTINVVNINVNVNLGLDRVTCVGSGMGLYAQGNFDTYLWSDGSTSFFTGVVSSGVYSVTVTKGVCYSVDEVVVTVEDEPIADFTMLVSSPNVQFTNTSNTTNNVVWSFGDLDTSYAVSPSHQYPGYGTYQVVLEVTNSCGSKSKTMAVGIFPQGSKNIYLNDNLIIFPTLASSQIQFSLDIQNKREIEYSVFDVVGKLLYRKADTYFGPDYLYQVNVSQFAAGTYYLRIVSEEEAIAVKSFVKQ